LNLIARDCASYHQVRFSNLISRNAKTPSKWLGAIIAVAVIAIAVFLINLIWFRPWSLNLFYEKVFAEVLFDHPEILSTLGLVEQFGITGHNGKLDDESPAQQQREFEAIAYMREKTGMGEKEVKSEIERYIVAPGQACAYKIGMLKIQELRARSQKELGEKFDQREFHDVVLKNGALPLEILEEQVNEYIQRKKNFRPNAR
jgi:hypothetical protein